MEERELVIIGGGPAGMAAAVYGKRAGLDLVVLEKGICGGQILITSEIENYIGQKHISGPELAKSFREHAEYFNAEFRKSTVKAIVPRDGAFTVVSSEGEIAAKAVIVATGAAFRRLGVKGEKEFTGAGVSYCAVCDGAFYQDSVIAVIGGGNTAVEEACYLTQFASKVYIVHRRDEFRADKMACERAACNDKVEPVWNSVLESINGSELVESITVKNVKSGELKDIEVEGVFVFVGVLPITKCLGELCEREEGGWVKTDAKMQTSIPGLFAAGDVRVTPLRQVITAVSDGAIAAMSAYHWITAGQC
ncbi:thioredoxin-disulfide reductase [Oceanidesulfovibrio marinus]|uniref:Thioredoxin reductase n=1 Tax=Oceanidesulfovibrio marinus TaxID=370038 RepID=A0A6P1ZIM6_9BACT|nr:thioredoxin-disulfide reductase [Oceanidesulfovibrio marinus]QJT07558.1 thioredoxin-disulfide reductase [Oceanidesulfovibrio marinus]TVM34527.1 thioredoxin-disulfide reductase [Oceanidesulfovibrio marinus]